jgi:hypothetical protein
VFPPRHIAKAIQGLNPGGLHQPIKDFRPGATPRSGIVRNEEIRGERCYCFATGAYFSTAPQRSKFWDFESDAEAGALGFLFAGA